MSGYKEEAAPQAEETASSSLVVFSIFMPGGAKYEVSVTSVDKVLALRDGFKKLHEVPDGCVAKLFQDGKLLIDTQPITDFDASQPLFAVVARETTIEHLLQAVGEYPAFTDIVREAGQEKGETTAEAVEPSRNLELGTMPNILDVLEEMGGKTPDLPNLAKGTDCLLDFSGADGDLINPCLDTAELLRAKGVEKFASVTISVEINSDAYNRGLGVVLQASPMMDSTIDDAGIPSYTYNGYGLSEDKRQNAVKFHPGMNGGQLRIEGKGGFGNTHIGFTPKSWTESGKKYHTLKLTLGADGNNQIRFQGTEGDQSWERSWSYQLTAGRYTPAVYAWLDLGNKDQPLKLGRIIVTINL